MKKVLYTFLSNQVDTLKEPKRPSPGWTRVCFTDSPNISSKDWDVEYVPLGDIVTSRKYKILVHNLFPDYDLSVYMDASFQVVAPLDTFALNKNRGIWLMRHPMRSCAYEEANVVIEKKIDDPAVVSNQIARYEEAGFPKNWGLWRCGIMVRAPRETQGLMETWWEEVTTGSFRDQISFPYSCWSTGTKPNTIWDGITEGFFRQSLHNPRATSNKIHVVTFDKYDGDELNSYIEKLPVEDWVLVHPQRLSPQKKEVSNVHLIYQDQVLLFPRWLHNYIRLQRNYMQERRWDETFLWLTSTLNGVVLK